MYAGRIVEIGPVQQVIHQPQHPYTVGLMASIPDWAARFYKTLWPKQTRSWCHA